MGRARRAGALRGILVLAAATLAVGAACGGGGGSSEILDAGPPHDVSGTMVAASSSAADGDSNDLLAPFDANDEPASAQEIPNPVTLGGHVNVAGAKPSSSPSGGPPPDGRTTVQGDPEDWYRVAIASGQIVRLLIAENGTSNDLDLELRRVTDEGLVASSATSSRTEEITVAATGEYYVVVVADSGFSNYTLTIGQATAAAAALPREPDFVPGEIVVRYRSDLAGPVAALGAEKRAANVGMRHVAGSVHGPMLFAVETPAERRAALRALGLAAGPEHGLEGAGKGAADDEAALRADTRRLVRALREQPGVASADLNYLRHPTASPTDEFYPFQWHYGQIHLGTAWDVVSPNSGVVVAVLDTGVKTAHPDLSGQLVGGYDFISDLARANDGNGCDGNPNDPGDGATPGTSSYHGTHVSGTVAARTSLQGGNSDGVAGVAWNARVMPLRVLGVGGGTDFDIMAALRYAADRDNACGSHPGLVADVVNMSLGGPGFSQTFQDLVTQLRSEEDMIFVASAGNDASNAPSYPAAYAGVISVSATGPGKTLAPYSSFGSTIDVAAPGGDFSRDLDGDGFPDGVLSTFFDEGNGSFSYAYYQGTSMAAPHVAGVLALMRGIDPALTPFDIDNALNAGLLTEDIGSSSFFGNGLLDGVKAVNLAAAGGGGSEVVDPFLEVDPDGLSFGFLADSFVLVAANGGNDDEPLTVTDVSFTSDDGASWLSLAAEAVDAQGLGRYRATVSRGALADGLYTGTIHFESDANDADVPVIMQVGDVADAGADAGHHFVLLVEPGTLTTVDSVQAGAVNGEYAFSFANVDPGEYLLIAGTDADGDFFICDAGEACGGYPTTETLVPISVQSDRSGLRFVTGFSGGIGSTSVVAPAGGWSRRIGEGPPP